MLRSLEVAPSVRRRSMLATNPPRTSGRGKRRQPTSTTERGGEASGDLIGWSIFECMTEICMPSKVLRTSAERVCLEVGGGGGQSVLQGEGGHQGGTADLGQGLLLGEERTLRLVRLHEKKGGRGEG